MCPSLAPEKNSPPPLQKSIVGCPEEVQTLFLLKKTSVEQDEEEEEDEDCFY